VFACAHTSLPLLRCRIQFVEHSLRSSVTALSNEHSTLVSSLDSLEHTHTSLTLALEQLRSELILLEQKQQTQEALIVEEQRSLEDMQRAYKEKLQIREKIARQSIIA
jgi:hypothetical protein